VRDRLFSSAIVIVVGLVPTLLGGPLFALFMLALGIAGYREYNALVSGASGSQVDAATLIGSLIIAGLAVTGFIASTNSIPLFALVTTAMVAPLVALWTKASSPGMLGSWALASLGSLYLGLPVYAAVALRSLPGTDVASVLVKSADALSLGWMPTPLGLGWTLTAVLATWVGDSAAYLVGQSQGIRKLAPQISPGKTIEGAIGGLVGSSAVGGVAFFFFELGPWWLGLITGCLIGIAGQIGDLCESFMKRQAGAKDSGTLLPGHGGILDRIDALFFAFSVSLVLASAFERLGIQ